MGEDVARRIENNLELADGHMDLQHHYPDYALHFPVAEHNRVAESDEEMQQALLSKVDQMQQGLSAKTRKVILRIERAAMEGRLSDADWEILEATGRQV